MKLQKRLNSRKKLRTNRTRAKVFGTADRPRLSIFRSNKFIYAQLINDKKSETMVSANDKEIINGSTEKHLNKTQRAKELGKLIAQKAKKAKINKVVFDKGPYKYHGRVKSVAEGVREGGIIF